VLETFYRTDEPLSAEQVAGGLDGRVPSSDLASVYRNLETLEALGLLRHFHLGHGPGMYARAGANPREYLVCERCQRAQAVEPAALNRARAAIKRQTGWRASFSHFPVAGICPTCAEGGDEA
jgi:Fur family ferric uptake transcriptional regulator